ncbi:MAG: YitT family protein [Peptococcaceae bacterium]|nr:YitT family protein [Peptococcaceae bacterium]
MELLGGFLVTVGVYNFAVYAKFPMTGFTGLALIAYRLWGLPIGISTIVLNIPVALLCYRLLGRGFFLRSFRAMVLSSLMIDYLGPLLPAYQGSRLLAAICTGVIAGLGFAIIYMQNSSTGGMDFITMSLKSLYPHVSLGKLIFCADAGIVLAGGLIFHDVDGIIYGMIITYLFAVVVDKTMYGVNSGKMALIVTDRGEEVAALIDESSGRGSTLLKAVGGYQKEHKDVVMCACNNKQMYQVQKAVRQKDPGSFIIILESNEVHGEGFRPILLGERELEKR